METTLTVAPPLTFDHTLERLRHFRASPGDREVGSGGATLTLPLRGRAVLVGVVGGAEPPDRAAHLRVTLQTEAPLSSDERDDTLLRLRRHLGLDDDVAGLADRAAGDPAFAPVLTALHGFRMVRHPTPFEAAVWAVVQQRTPNRFAYATMARLADLLGPSLELGGRRFRASPEPEAFLYDAHAALLEATNNTRKVERLLPLAEAFAAIDERWLHDAPYDEVRRRLEAIHGVGRWSSEYVLLRGLGRFERTPWSDTGLMAAISRAYTGGFAISRGDARALAERYGWHQGLWAHYLKVAAYGGSSDY